VPAEDLKTFRQALAQHHLHPNAKADRAHYLAAGPTGRRRVAAGIRLVGKDANHWEEQLHLGSDPEAQVEYGLLSEDGDEYLETVREACRRYSRRYLRRVVAAEAGLSPWAVANLVAGSKPTRATLARLRAALERVHRDEEQRTAEVREALQGVRRLVGIRGLRDAARELGVSPSVLSRALSGLRGVSPSLWRSSPLLAMDRSNYLM